MKYVSIAIAALLLGACNGPSGERQSQNDLALMQLSGPVKSVRQTTEQLFEGEPEPYSVSPKSYSFDQSGMLTECRSEDNTLTAEYDGNVRTVTLNGSPIRIATTESDSLRTDEGSWNWGEYNGGVYTNRFEFDERGRIRSLYVEDPVCEQIFDCNGFRYTFFYKDGETLPYRFTEEVSVGGDGYYSDCTVEYGEIDEYGNWLSRTVRFYDEQQDDSTDRIREVREIEYY